jgi:four helix bundle protein
VLSFQRLDVYQRAIEFLALVGDVVGELPKGHADRADQLVRAAESVVRNIAEGAGRWSEADCSKHYKIARGSAMECAASLDVMRIRRLVPPEQYERGIRLLEAVVAMLTKMLWSSKRDVPVHVAVHVKVHVHEHDDDDGLRGGCECTVVYIPRARTMHGSDDASLGGAPRGRPCEAPGDPAEPLRECAVSRATSPVRLGSGPVSMAARTRHERRVLRSPRRSERPYAPARCRG